MCETLVRLAAIYGYHLLKAHLPLSPTGECKQSVIIMVSPVGNYSMLVSYIVIAKTNSKYGYISRGRAFFKGYIGYIEVHRA